MKTKRMIIRFFILMVAFLCCTSAPAQNDRGTMQRKNMPTRKSNRTPNSFRTPQRQDFNQNGSEVRRHRDFQREMPQKSNDNTVYDVVEVMPSFPGGEQNLHSWLTNNLRYPAAAANNGIQGRVIVQCIIEKNGSITIDKVSRGVDPLLDQEALRLIKAMPKWNPGKQNGYAVRTKRMIIVPFKING